MSATDPVEVLLKYRDISLREEHERDIWKKCYAYTNSRVDGELGQWKQEIRKELTAQGRPPTSFNITKKFVNLICGSQANTKLDEKAFPRDDDSDPMLAEVLTDLIKYVKDVNDAELAISRMFRDGIICSRGFIKTCWSNDLDPLGEITISAINPFRIYIIGEGENYDISKDRKGIIEEIPMDKDAIIARWPDKADEINSMMVDFDDTQGEKNAIPIAKTYDYGFGLSVPTDYVFDREDKKLKVLRCQRMIYKKAKFFKDKLGKLSQAPDDQDEFQTAADLIKANGQDVNVVDQPTKYIQVSYSIGKTLLEDDQSPYKFGQYDITGFFCYDDNGVYTGVVQDLLDPQDEKNKRRSQAIHLLGTAAKNSFFVTKGTFDDINKARTEMGKTGSLIEVNKSPRDAVTPIESNTTAVPALVQMELQSSNDMKDISGLNDASLGVVPQGVKSGRGINALQQPTESIVGTFWNNYLSTRKIVFRKVLALIQQYYTEERRVRVLGDYSSRFMPPEIIQIKDQLKTQILLSHPLFTEEQAILMADQMIQVQNGFKVITINKSILEKKLNDVTSGRFDVILDEVSQSSTMRQQQYQNLLNMRSLGAPIPWDEIVKVSDIRGRAEILSRMAEEQQRMDLMAMAQQQAKSATPAKGGSNPNAPLPQPADEMLNQAGAQF